MSRFGFIIFEHAPMLLFILTCVSNYRSAIDIVKNRFPDYALKKQDFLGNEDRCNKVLQLVPDESILRLC